MNRTSGIALPFLIFAVVWTAVTGVADVVILRNIYRQVRASRYPATSGRVTRSQVMGRRDDDGGMLYRADVEYDYEVDGIRHHGDRYRYGSGVSSGRSRYDDVVRRYPVGKAVHVYYNPQTHGDAVLETGVGGLDLFFLVVLTPFNLAMLWLWSLSIGGLYRRFARPPAGGVPILQRGMTTIVRLPRIPPLAAAAVSAFLISIVSILVFVVGTDMNPHAGHVWIVWGLILVAAPTVYLWRVFVVGSGAKDLVIDRQRQVMSLPRTWGRQTDVQVPFDQVQDVRVQRSHRGRSTSYTYVPTLVWRDDRRPAVVEKLADWHDDTRARSFVNWLREQIGTSAESSLPRRFDKSSEQEDCDQTGTEGSRLCASSSHPGMGDLPEVWTERRSAPIPLKVPCFLFGAFGVYLLLLRVVGVGDTTGIVVGFLCLCGFLVVLVRTDVQIDRRARLLTKSWRLLLPLSSTDTRLEEFDRVTLGLTTFRVNDRPVLAVVLNGRSRVVWKWLLSYEEARRIGERLAEFVWLPLDDETSEETVRREPESLQESLRDRARREGKVQAPPEAPSHLRSTIRTSEGALTIEIPPQPFGPRLLIPLFIALFMLTTVVLPLGGFSRILLLGALAYAALRVYGSERHWTFVNANREELQLEFKEPLRRRRVRIPADEIEELTLYRSANPLEPGGILVRSDRETATFGGHLSEQEQEYLRDLARAVLTA